jgi:hypothetical protein
MFSGELRCSLLSYAAPCELHYSVTELPSELVPLCNFVKCQNAGLSGTGISVPQSGAGTLRYRTEILDAGISITAASASMPMVVCGVSERESKRSPHNRKQFLIRSAKEAFSNLPREDLRRAFSKIGSMR